METWMHTETLKKLEEIAAEIRKLTDIVCKPRIFINQQPGVVAVHPGPKEKGLESSDPEPTVCYGQDSRCICFCKD